MNAQESKAMTCERKVMEGYEKLTSIENESRQEYYEEYRNGLLEIKDEGSFDDFYHEMDDAARFIFDCTTTHTSYREVMLMVDNHEMENSLMDYKKDNERMLTSHSWKITKPLRVFNKKLR